MANLAALFLLPCGDSECKDGGHDVTDLVMQRLRDAATEFIVEHACGGDLRGAPCGRVVRVRAAAKYAEV